MRHSGLIIDRLNRENAISGVPLLLNALLKHHFINLKLRSINRKFTMCCLKSLALEIQNHKAKHDRDASLNRIYSL